MIKEIRDRRSVRKYKNKEVEDEKIMEILESARLSPSGSNTQPWRFIIVKSVEGRETLSKVCHNQKWMNQAPVFIVCVADLKCRLDKEDIEINENSSENEVKQIIRDTALCIENILLSATNLNLGSCTVAWFIQEDIKNALNIPKDKYVVSVITIGYPDEEPKRRPRKELKEMICYEKWEE